MDALPISKHNILLFSKSLEFFTNSLQHKNDNIANFILALPLGIN